MKSLTGSEYKATAAVDYFSKLGLYDEAQLIPNNDDLVIPRYFDDPDSPDLPPSPPFLPNNGMFNYNWLVLLKLET